MSGHVAVSGYRERNSTADRALEILMMFTEDEPTLSGAVVAERLGVARSTVYRYLQSLVSHRFLEEAPAGGYRLGLRVLEMARLARRGYGLSDVALPVMSDLAARTGETVLLTRRVGDLVVCLDRTEIDARAVRISYDRGSTLPINAGASALTLLAWTPEDEARRVLKGATLRRFTPDTLTDVDALLERLTTIREQGYAITRSELDVDVVGIAAPVRDEHHRVLAAVSVVALASRVDADAEAAIVPQVLAAATEIADRLVVVAG